MKVYSPPLHYFGLFPDWPEDVIKVDDPKPESLDIIHVFATNRESLEALVPLAKPNLKKNGSLWVSWPKGTSGLPTDINREVVREFVLRIGLVDIKVAAVDDKWSGLKFMYRKADR